MNTILVVMLLAGRFYTPAYAVVYPTEEECKAALTKVMAGQDRNLRSAVCVPQVKESK